MTAVCKVEGCGRPEKASRGRYAHLCTAHIAELQNAADRVADAAFEVQAAKEKLEAAAAEAQTIRARIANQ